MVELGAFLLPAVPLLALLLCLLLGCYPGVEAVARLSEWLALPRRPQAAPPARALRPQPPRSFAPGGGLLLALSLAQRPPPLLA